MSLYKVLDEEGGSCNGGIANWNLPKKGDEGKWKPGKWMPVIKGALVPCENGYHLCRPQDVIEWFGGVIYEAEYKGEKREGESKIVVRKCRLQKRCENWTEESARLFACWCVRNTPLADGRTVWDLLTEQRSRAAVEMAERYARGNATADDLNAARAAAWAAVGAAAGDAAGDAAWAAARDAAWAAARAAAGDDARDAVGDDARAVAWAAAWAVARAAAGAAARAAAGAAARTAAWAAARTAAWDDAWAAARDAQTKELLRILEAEEITDK